MIPGCRCLRIWDIGPQVLLKPASHWADEVTPWSHMDYGVTHEYSGVRGATRPCCPDHPAPCNRAHAVAANHLLGGPL